MSGWYKTGNQNHDAACAAAEARGRPRQPPLRHKPRRTLLMLRFIAASLRAQD
jgi:hypothetical protein